MLYVSIEVNKVYADIAAMDTMTAGAYMQLLYRTLTCGGILKSNDYTLKRLLNSQAEKIIAEELLSAFFYQDNDGNWRNQDADELIGRAQDRSEKASKAAQARHSSNANAMLTQCTSNANAMLKRKPSNAKLSEVKLSEDIYPPTPQEGGVCVSLDANAGGEGGRLRGVTVSKPDGLADQVWADFVAMRRTVTQTALDEIDSQAAIANLSLTDAITLMVKRGWKNFDAKWAIAEREKSAALDADLDQQKRADAATRADSAPSLRVSPLTIFKPEPSIVPKMPVVEGQLTVDDCPPDLSPKLFARFLQFRNNASKPTTKKTVAELVEKGIKQGFTEGCEVYSMLLSRNTAIAAEH